MNALIDTNVWLDIAVRRPGFVEGSEGAVGICLMEGIEACITPTSLKDIFYLTTKWMSAPMAYEFLERVQDIATILPIDEAICAQAMDLERPDYEDGLIAAIALAEQVDLIITRDDSAFTSLGIEKLTPRAFIDRMGYEEISFCPSRA